MVIEGQNFLAPVGEIIVITALILAVGAVYLIILPKSEITQGKECTKGNMIMDTEILNLEVRLPRIINPDQAAAITPWDQL